MKVRVDMDEGMLTLEMSLGEARLIEKAVWDIKAPDAHEMVGGLSAALSLRPSTVAEATINLTTDDALKGGE